MTNEFLTENDLFIDSDCCKYLYDNLLLLERGTCTKYLYIFFYLTLLSALDNSNLRNVLLGDRKFGYRL